jgi:hypothetical protein
MARYTKGKHAVAIDDRSGFKVKHKDLRKEWTGMMVYKGDWESKQAQLDPSKYFKNTGSNVLENPRPDNDNDSAIVRLGPLNQQFQGVMQMYQGLETLQGFVVNVTEVPPGQEAGTALGSFTFSSQENLTGIAAGSTQGAVGFSAAENVAGIAAGTALGSTGLSYMSTEVPPGIAAGTALGSVTLDIDGWGNNAYGQSTWGGD